MVAAPFPERTYCRLTVLAPRANVDVALPADVPVAELVPMVLELVGEPAPRQRPESWRLSGAAGGVLPASASLAELGVLDGELLRIGPDIAPPAAPVFDDPVDAMAATTASRAGEHRFAAAAVLLAALAAAVLLAGAAGSVATLLIAVLGVVGALAHTAVLARQTLIAGASDAANGAAHTAALCAVLLAAGGGWAVMPGPEIGPHLLLASVAAGVAAAVAQVVLRVVAPVLVAIVTASVWIAAGVLALRLGAGSAAAAAGVGALALISAPLLPRAAVRLAGLPRPIVPADATELVEADNGPDILPPEELAERADLARGFLAGLVGGNAVVTAAAAVVAAGAASWSGPAFAGVVVLVLLLRVRGYADAAPARTSLLAAVGTGTTLAVLAVVQVEEARAAAAGALLLVVAAGVTVMGRGRPVGSPVLRRAVDLLEGLLVAAAVPLALGAMDVYQLVRSL